MQEIKDLEKFGDREKKSTDGISRSDRERFVGAAARLAGEEGGRGGRRGLRPSGKETGRRSGLGLICVRFREGHI